MTGFPLMAGDAVMGKHYTLTDVRYWHKADIPCPFRKSYPGVLVMQPGQDRNGDNGARSLGCSVKRRIFL